MLLVALEVPSADQSASSDAGFCSVIFDAALRRNRFDVGRALVDDIFPSIINAPLPPFIRSDQRQCFIGKLKALNLVTQQIFISQVRALMVQGDPVRDIPLSKAERKTDCIIGIYQSERWSIQIELGMDAAAEVRLPIIPPAVVDMTVEAENFPVASDKGMNVLRFILK